MRNSKRNYDKRKEEVLEKGFWYWVFHSYAIWILGLSVLFFGVGIIVGFIVLYLIYWVESPGKIYQCEKCKKTFRDPKKCKEHEKGCIKNDN